jgi:hypothetical protein
MEKKHTVRGPGKFLSPETAGRVRKKKEKPERTLVYVKRNGRLLNSLAIGK